MDFGRGRGRGRFMHPSNRGRGRQSSSIIRYGNTHNTGQLSSIIGYGNNPGQSSEIIKTGNNPGPGSSSGYIRPNNILAQYGEKRLIAKNLCDNITKEEFEEFQIWKQKELNISSPSFKKIMKESLDEKEKMVKSPEEREIIILQNSDKKWEDNPWLLYNRYLTNNQYPMETYKSRSFYEGILSENECNFNHWEDPGNFWKFSKINIKRIISIEEWGITPSTSKTLVNKNNIKVEYNYWDYVQAFDKVFLYENPTKSHTWLIKIYPEVFDQNLPNWLIKWWQFYGTNENILPQMFKNLYDEWKDLIPKTDQDDIPVIIQLNFFIEFSIPWIWKFIPKTGYNDLKLFCLKRESYSRFWEAMMRQDKDTNELKCIYTINLIQDKIDSMIIFNAEESGELEEHQLSEELFQVENKTEAEILSHYTKLAERALAQRQMHEDSKSQTSDVSMAISTASNSKNKFDILQDAQEMEAEIDVQLLIEEEITKKKAKDAKPKDKGKIVE